MQKFKHGDLVHITDELPSSMSHFPHGVDAVVIGSYADKYGGTDRKSYTLHLKGRGEISWYEEGLLTRVESGRSDLLEQWKTEKEREDKERSDLDWIFANGQSVLTLGYGASVEALARCFTEESLWGRTRGEGYIWYQNALAAMALAEPFLLVGDKSGWLLFCEDLKNKTAAQADTQEIPDAAT